MKKAKFVPIILASALLASCGADLTDSSNAQQSASSITTGGGDLIFGHSRADFF